MQLHADLTSMQSCAHLALVQLDVLNVDGGEQVLEQHSGQLQVLLSAEAVQNHQRSALHHARQKLRPGLGLQPTTR